MSVMTANLSSPRPGATHVDAPDFAEVVDMGQRIGASSLVMDANCLGEPTVGAFVGSTTDDLALSCDMLVVPERIQTAP